MQVQILSDLFKEKKMLIYLDVDGVVADWVKGIHEATDIEPNLWDTVGHGLLPTSNQTLVDKAMSARAFWVGLSRYPWAKELYEVCRKHGEVVFCTQPFDSPEALAGKYEWLHNHFGVTMENIILMRNKWRLANPRALLIDDNIENCNRFQWAGGHSIVFPQAWNTAELILTDPETRKYSLEQIYESIANISRIVKWYT